MKCEKGYHFFFIQRQKTPYTTTVSLWGGGIMDSLNKKPVISKCFRVGTAADGKIRPVIDPLNSRPRGESDFSVKLGLGS